MPDAHALADPALLARISDLDLIARRIVDGVVSGLHRSPFHGFSAEFHQYRHYRPGDDLKHVDWKVFARTDRFYTKQFRETTNVPASLIIDTSGSMGFAGRSSLTKLRYAVVLAAALAHLLTRQGDQVALQLGDMASGHYLGLRGGRVHQRAILHALSRAVATGTWSAAATVRHVAQRLSRRGLLLVFSDFYDEEADTLAALRHVAGMGHEVAMFQVLTRDETDFTYAGVCDFEDVETGAATEIDGAAVREAYRRRISAFLDTVRASAQSAAIDYSLLHTDTAPDVALRRYLVRQPGPRSAS